MGPDGKSFRNDGRAVEDYLCYRLPILASAAGTIVKVVGAVADNAVGDLNLKQNWGNLVMIQHGPALFSLVAHLAPGSCKVREGQSVQRGDVLGLCGNSGRSPVPHVHFQLQATPILGADTLPMAFNDTVVMAAGAECMEISLAPGKNAVVRNLDSEDDLRAVFNFRDGDVWHCQSGSSIERVMCEVDVLGQTRFRSCEHSASMVFERTDDYFISYDVMGDRNSVLQLVRAALPKVPFEDNPRIVWRDFVPVRAATALFSLTELTAPLLGPAGLEVEYTMLRHGSRWVIAGGSIRQDREGAAVLQTRVELGQVGPLVIDVTWRGQHRRATRLLANTPEVQSELQASRKDHEDNAHPAADGNRVSSPSLLLD
jgi:hypothetical protein